jgi:hypothetical protein
LVIRYGL